MVFWILTDRMRSELNVAEVKWIVDIALLSKRDVLKGSKALEVGYVKVNEGC
mgnify:CR=1 FL=1